VNILVISSNLIGDTILSTGIIKHFFEKYPNSKFTFVVGPSAAQIYKNFPNLEKIIKIKKKRYNFHWFKIWNECYAIKWNIIIDFRSSLISYFLFNKKKFIFRASNKGHKIDQLKNFFKTDEIPYPIIYNNKDEINIAKKKLDKNKKYIVICPGGNWIPKIWPLDNYIKLINMLNKNFKDLVFIIVGSKKEENTYLNRISDQLKDLLIINLMGESITTTAAYMKKSNLFIGNDSGLMHLSVASKIATIGLFGPTNEKIYAPFGNNCYTLRTKDSYDEFKDNYIDKNRSYMISITTEDVFDFIKSKKLL
tara:strand:+ start:336 stop:1259 length:924 start_codon:yes stop_codon:yes gene_type:complete